MDAVRFLVVAAAHGSERESSAAIAPLCLAACLLELREGSFDRLGLSRINLWGPDIPCISVEARDGMFVCASGFESLDVSSRFTEFNK